MQLKCAKSLFQAVKSALLVAALVSIPLQSWSGDAGKTFTKGPYLQAPGLNTMTVMWESTVNGDGFVLYGLDGKLDQKAKAGAPRIVTDAGTQYYLYKAIVSGLKPGTTYSYAVEQHGAKSEPRKFRTFAEKSDKVSFIGYGDTRSNPDTHAGLAKWFRQYNPEFIIHTGDLVAKGKQFDLWEKEFFTPLKGVIDEVPLLAAIGNHEDDGTNYLAQFHMADNELWYSFDAGPVHFLALDFRSTNATDAQFAFAEKDLMASKAPWKVVFLHIPMFNIGGHNSLWGHDAYLPLMHKARVDLIVSGHSHLYERFKPLTNEADKGKWAITHITTGGGGAPLYGTIENPAHASYVAVNHFIAFEATPTTIKGKAVNLEGKVFDEFEIKKTNGQYDQAWLSSACSEAELAAAIKAAPHATGGSKGKSSKKSKK